MRRLRRTLAAAAGSAALALALPTASAHAATGYFSYVYEAPGGGARPGFLVAPPSGKCVTLPEAIQEYLPPAHSPRNHTASTATVFAGPYCTGAHFTLRPEGGHGSERLKLRSVRFS
ncbi:hypothetical protein ACH4YO_17905 [Streptomyces noursei]|uniref:hypothetical protein n=1 Tax=Streptomyces noursei TaxID=1971 RepID=UPI00081C9938|nr:hypothetical protein SNOUR_20005 [Streptomyces noursei ATCC 11455]MCZ0994237.1 hypothetical protein [Streptomyces noursei]